MLDHEYIFDNFVLSRPQAFGIPVVLMYMCQSILSILVCVLSQLYCYDLMCLYICLQSTSLQFIMYLTLMLCLYNISLCFYRVWVSYDIIMFVCLYNTFPYQCVSDICCYESWVGVYVYPGPILFHLIQYIICVAGYFVTCFMVVLIVSLSFMIYFIVYNK